MVFTLIAFDNKGNAVPVQTGLWFFLPQAKKNCIIAKHVYTRRFAFSIVHVCSLVVVLILDLAWPVWLGCEMMCFCSITGTTIINSVVTALFHWLQFHYIYPAKVKIESMVEYSEAKIYKSKPELRNSKMLTIFIHQSGNNNYCHSYGVCFMRKTTDMLHMLADMCASSLEYLM